jgi:hypothetical protein
MERCAAVGASTGVKPRKFDGCLGGVARGVFSHCACKTLAAATGSTVSPQFTEVNGGWPRKAIRLMRDEALRRGHKSW